jgi:hypothetical protein
MSEAKSNLPALREADPNTILARYLSDESTKDIAASYGVTRQALGQYMLRHAEEQWKDAQVARALARKEEAEDEYDLIKSELRPESGKEVADVDVSLARMKLAERALKAAHWDLERVCRRIYGQDVTPEQLGRVSITLNIGVQPQQPGEVIDMDKPSG